MNWNLDFLSMSISAGCVSDPGRGTWMVLLSAGILFCWAGSVDEDGIYGYLLRGGISSQQAETFNRKIVTAVGRRILDEDNTSVRPGDLSLTPRAGLTPAAATVPLTHSTSLTKTGSNCGDPALNCPDQLQPLKPKKKLIATPTRCAGCVPDALKCPRNVFSRALVPNRIDGN
jgi:hypothetical protein